MFSREYISKFARESKPFDPILGTCPPNSTTEFDPCEEDDVSFSFDV